MSAFTTRLGRLLGESGATDVVDGTVVDIAADGDEILTSDFGDLRSLAVTSGKRVLITRVS